MSFGFCMVRAETGEDPGFFLGKRGWGGGGRGRGAPLRNGVADW